MTVTSSTAQKPATTATPQAGRFNFAAAKKILAGSSSFWGAATTVSLLGSAGLKKGPATYNAQAMLKGAGVNLTDEQKQKVAEGTRATAQLEQANQATQSERKGAAAQKIKQLKERLKQLMMAGGDPKQIARQAAQLARELKEAVREYGAASGGSAPEGGDSPSLNALAAEGGGEAGAGGTADAAANGASGVGPAAVEAKAAETAAKDAVAKVSEGVDVEEDPSGAEKPQTDEERYQALMDRVGKMGAEAEAAKAEREFINDIKNLAHQIKALFARKKNEAEKEKGSDMDLTQDGKAVNESMREIDDVVQGLEDALNEKVAGMAAGLMPEAPMDPGMAAAPMGSIVSVIA